MTRPPFHFFVHTHPRSLSLLPPPVIYHWQVCVVLWGIKTTHPPPPDRAGQLLLPRNASALRPTGFCCSCCCLFSQLWPKNKRAFVCICCIYPSVCVCVLALFVSEEDGLQVQHVGRGGEREEAEKATSSTRSSTPPSAWFTCGSGASKHTHTYKRFGERFFSCVGGESDGCFNEPVPHPLRLHLIKVMLSWRFALPLGQINKTLTDPQVFNWHVNAVPLRLHNVLRGLRHHFLALFGYCHPEFERVVINYLAHARLARLMEPQQLPLIV